MPLFSSGHRRSHFAPQRFGSRVRRGISRRVHSGMRFGAVPESFVVAYGWRCRSAVLALPLSLSPNAADRVSRMPPPHSVLATASAYRTASAMLLAFSFCAVPASRPRPHQALERSNITFKNAPYGRSGAPQAARHLL